MTTLCGCLSCMNERAKERIRTRTETVLPPGFRYACEKCGNKRCPHHSDHTLACTKSNEPGQTGSVL